MSCAVVVWPFNVVMFGAVSFDDAWVAAVSAGRVGDFDYFGDDGWY